MGVISDVTPNGEVYKPNQKYHAVPSTSNLGGEGATFSVFTNAVEVLPHQEYQLYRWSCG